MRLLTDADVERLPWEAILSALRDAFRDPSRYRTVERVRLGAPAGGSWLAMPCADADGWFGVKQVSVLPGNRARGLASVRAWYTLMGPDGAPCLGLDATVLTQRRTAAASALAADALADPAARRLLVVGAGALAPWLARAHLRVRRYRRVAVWARRPTAAAALASALSAHPEVGGAGVVVEAARDLERAVREADTVTVATTSREALVRGAWLQAGPHLDLVGAFVPDMREADADAVRASQVWVDDRAAARAEAGDLLQAAAEGWRWDAVAGDLSDLVTGRARRDPERPTLFKSVGLALEDLAVARLLAGALPA